MKATKIIREPMPVADIPSQAFLVRVRGTFGDIDLTVYATNAEAAKDRVIKDFLSGLTVTKEF